MSYLEQEILGTLRDIVAELKKANAPNLVWCHPCGGTGRDQFPGPTNGDTCTHCKGKGKVPEFQPEKAI